MSLTHRVRTSLLVLALAVLYGLQTASAAVRLPAVFSNDMVLQQNTAAPIWGWADPNEKLTIRLDGKAVDAQAGADGRWKAALPATPAGGPHKIVVQGSDRKLRSKA